MKKKIKKSLRKMKRDDIEDMITTKCVELLTNKSELGKLRQQVDSYQETVERWKRRAGALSKQCTDLSTVMRKYITDTKHRGRDKVMPVRITRSVGLQVSCHHPAPPDLTNAPSVGDDSRSKKAPAAATFRSRNSSSSHSCSQSRSSSFPLPSPPTLCIRLGTRQCHHHPLQAGRHLHQTLHRRGRPVRRRVSRPSSSGQTFGSCSLQTTAGEGPPRSDAQAQGSLPHSGQPTVHSQSYGQQEHGPQAWPTFWPDWQGPPRPPATHAKPPA